MIEKKSTEKSIINNPNNLSDKSLDSVSGGWLFKNSKMNTQITTGSGNTDSSKTLVIGDGATVSIGGKLDM